MTTKGVLSGMATVIIIGYIVGVALLIADGDVSAAEWLVIILVGPSAISMFAMVRISKDR